MDIIICCLCSLACFLAGAAVARGPAENTSAPEPSAMPDDPLQKDIETMLRYGGGWEEDTFDSRRNMGEIPEGADI